MLDPHQIEDLRQTLLAKQDELQGLVDQTKADRSAVELDQAKVGRLSRMDALQMQAMAQAADRRRALELQKIKSALDRIDSGDYGYCVACDEVSEIKRLQNDPAVPTCIGCAAR